MSNPVTLLHCCVCVLFVMCSVKYFHQCIKSQGSASVKLRRHIACYFRIFFSLFAAAHVVSNCAANNTSLTYLMNNSQYVVLKKLSSARRCAVFSQSKRFFIAIELQRAMADPHVEPGGPVSEVVTFICRSLYLSDHL